MNTYIVLRRSSWRSPQELKEAAARSTEVGGQMAGEIRWIRSYVLDEGSGSLGTVCVYQAESPEALRTHAARAVMACDEVIPIADTVVVRPDPASNAAG